MDLSHLMRFLLTFPIGRIALALFAIFHIQSAAAAGIRDGLVGYWPFDERAGQVASDASGFGQPGALINFTNDNRHWVAGLIAGALEFRGTNSRECVRIPDFIKPTNTMSFSAWVYAESVSQFATVAANFNFVGTFSINAGYWASNFFVWSAEQATGITPLHYIEDPQPLPLGVWHHIGFVADGTHIQMWRNGAFIGADRYNGTINNTIPYLDIGGRPDAPPAQTYWDGKIDDVGFWTRALTFNEMRAIYVAGLAGRPLTSINFPTISSIADRTLNEGAPPLQIPFTISDLETPAAELSVSASSSNPSVIRDSDLLISGAASERSLTLNLAPDAHGPTTITVTVTDGSGFTTSAVFTVVVVPKNDAPVAVAVVAPVFVPPFDLPNILVLSANGSNALVHFDASGSYDVDSSLLAFSWFVEAEPFAMGALASRLFPVGSHTVSVGVSDGELTSTATLTFDVITAADTLNLLVIAINHATLTPREQRPLLATLKSAINALDRGNTTAAVSQLKAFRHKLRAQVDPAAPFVGPLQIAVQQIIDSLSAD